MSFNPFTLWRWAYLTRYERYLKVYEDGLARHHASRTVVGCALVNVLSLGCLLIALTGGIHLPSEIVIPLLVVGAFVSVAWISSYIEMSEELEPMWHRFVVENEEQRTRRGRLVIAYETASFLVLAASFVCFAMAPRSNRQEDSSTRQQMSWAARETGYRQKLSSAKVLPIRGGL